MMKLYLTGASTFLPRAIPAEKKPSIGVISMTSAANAKSRAVSSE